MISTQTKRTIMFPGQLGRGKMRLSQKSKMQDCLLKFVLVMPAGLGNKKKQDTTAKY